MTMNSNSDRNHSPHDNNNHGKESWNRNGSSVSASLASVSVSDLHEKFCRSSDKFVTPTSTTTHLTSVIPHFDLSPPLVGKKATLSDHELASWGLTSHPRNGKSLFLHSLPGKLDMKISWIKLVKVKGHQTIRLPRVCFYTSFFLYSVWAVYLLSQVKGVWQNTRTSPPGKVFDRLVLMSRSFQVLFFYSLFSCFTLEKRTWERKCINEFSLKDLMSNTRQTIRVN